MGKINPKAEAAKKNAGPAKGGKQQPPAPSPSKALAVVNRETSTAVTTAVNVQSLLAEDIGSGLEGMTKDDFAVPRLTILQSLSPAVNKRGEDYVEGAEVGMIYDNVSGALYDGQEGILMVLVQYRRSHLEWWPRDSKKGKGFVADHGPDPSILTKTTRTDKGQNLLPTGSEIVPTAEYFGFVVDEATGSYERVLIPMSKTQLIKAKRLNTMASTLLVDVPGKGKAVAPLFYRTYLFKTKPESNDKGNWFGWDITPGPLVAEIKNGTNIYLEARAFKQSVVKGEVKVATPVADDGHGSAGTGADDDEAPM
jgi:hypothetical protein